MRDQVTDWLSQAVGHLTCVHHQLSTQMGRELPADDYAAVAIEDEGEVDEAVPAPGVGDVSDPLFVWPGRREVAPQEVARPLERCLVRDRRALLLAAADALKPLSSHQSRDVVATDVDSLALELFPGLPDAVNAAVARLSSQSASSRRDGFRDLRA